jgi:hypothetical protein
VALLDHVTKEMRYSLAAMRVQIASEHPRLDAPPCNGDDVFCQPAQQWVNGEKVKVLMLLEPITR